MDNNRPTINQLITYTPEEVNNKIEKHMKLKQTKQTTKQTFDDVNCPKHYADSKIEVIDYIEDKNLGFCLGNVVKYVSRAGKKHSADKTDKEKEIQDLKKAKWYLERRIKELEEELCY